MSCSCYKKIKPERAYYYFEPQISLVYVAILILILLVFGDDNGKPIKRKRNRRKEADDHIILDKNQDFSLEILPYLYLILLFNILNKDKENENSESYIKIMDNDDKKQGYSKFVNNSDLGNSEYSTTAPKLATINDLDKNFEDHELEGEHPNYINNRQFEAEHHNYTDNRAEFSDLLELVHDNKDCSLEVENSATNNNLLSSNKLLPENSLLPTDNLDNKGITAPLANLLRNDYRGVMVSAMLPNGVIVNGEVVFNFAHIVALKYDNSTIFINEDMIICFY